MTGPLTMFPFDPNLDLDDWVGQRSATFRFDLTNGVTGEILRELHPVRGVSLSHDTSRTIKRQLTMPLGAIDTASVNTITDRITVTMVFPNGAKFPLGRYMFTDSSRIVFTSGKLSAVALNDEMFMVDQAIETGINGEGKSVTKVVQEALGQLLIPVTATIEPTPFNSVESWGIGIGRGQVLESLAVSGDWFSPWFGNDAQLHFIRTFDPHDHVLDFNFDLGNKVLRESIVETDDLITAPNRIIVISNAADTSSAPVVGVADIPTTAPHSIANRGFVIADVRDLQITNSAQAAAIAQGLVRRQTIFERVTLTTAPDPRHDSYNVIQWQGERWLELAWSMPLEEGASMTHTLRKAYS